MISRIVIYFLILFSLVSCSKEEVAYVENQKENPYEIYKTGLDAFEKREYFFAEKKFTQAELGFVNIDLKAKAAIMSCFSLYAINFYERAIINLDRFIKTYPANKNLIYAKYLKAIIYFEQISDETKDLNPLLNAQREIDEFQKSFPNTDYSIDLSFKKKLIVNQLAAKELYVAKYYISVQKWAAAIKRLKEIINTYDQSIFIEEALHRLVEIHYHIGAVEEAKNYAKILGYNYNSSEWFKQSYKILNREYEIPKIKKVDKNKNFFKKIIDKISLTNDEKRKN